MKFALPKNAAKVSALGFVGGWSESLGQWPGAFIFLNSTCHFKPENYAKCEM